MKLKKNITKKNLICSSAMAAAAVAAHILCGISLFNMLLFILLDFAVLSLEAEWDKRLDGVFAVGAIAMGSALSTWLVQYLLLAEDLRSRISDHIFRLNILCSLVVYLVLYFVINRVDIACILAHLFLMLFAGANYFVYEFRGNELTFSDLKAFGTGLSVASNYRFSLNAQAMNVILLTAVYFAALAKLRLKRKRSWTVGTICLSCILLCALYLAQETGAMVTQTWEQKGSYQNGYLVNFILSIRDSFVKKPDTYSEELIAGLEKEYEAEETSGAKEDPDIIVIMNESFADFRVLGEMQTNQPVMPFFDSLQENTVKGYALSSVFGSKTPNSEWEFLTGNSMAFLPEGSVAYQQYLEEDNAYSIVDTLKKREYTCVAMHPYYATGWSRDTVYPELGFDEMYFLDDFDQSSLMRRYVSDAVMYDRLIQRYEESEENEKMFLFGVTMQNHGGYRDTYENFSTDVYGLDIRYMDVNQYLSLAHQSDLALQKLISYFSKADRPVAICFFGDHQPSLNSYFYKKINGKGLSGLSLAELEELFQVPFFIWTNYESESKEVSCTSLNYLSTLLMQQAKIPLTPYQRFLSDLMEAVPAMNGRAYYSNALDKFVHYGEGTAEDEIWMEKYRNLQYNGLFDGKNKSQVFFGRGE